MLGFFREKKIPLFFPRIVNPVSLSFISSSGRLNLLLLCFGSLLLFLLVNYSYFYTSLIAWRICSSIYGYSYSYLYFCSSIFLFFCWDVEVNLTFGWKLKIDEVKERSKFRPSAYSEFSIDKIWYAVPIRERLTSTQQSVARPLLIHSTTASRGGSLGNHLGLIVVCIIVVGIVQGLLLTRLGSVG